MWKNTRRTEEFFRRVFPYPSILRIFILCYFRFLQRRRDYSCEISGIERFIRVKTCNFNFRPIVYRPSRLFIDRESSRGEIQIFASSLRERKLGNLLLNVANPLANVYILLLGLLSPESFVMKFIFLRSTRFRSIILYEKNKKQIQDGICSLKIWNIEWNSDVCVQNCTKCYIQRVNNVNNRGILAFLEMFRYMEMETSYKSTLSLEFRYFSTLLFPCLNNFLGEPGICNISQWRMDDSTFKDVKFVKTNNIFLPFESNACRILRVNQLRRCQTLHVFIHDLERAATRH